MPVHGEERALIGNRSQSSAREGYTRSFNLSSRGCLAYISGPVGEIKSRGMGTLPNCSGCLLSGSRLARFFHRSALISHPSPTWAAFLMKLIIIERHSSLFSRAPLCPGSTMNVMIEFRAFLGWKERNMFGSLMSSLFFGGPHDWLRRNYFLYGSCNAHLSIKHLIK
jgi:hypothetical protein